MTAKMQAAPVYKPSPEEVKRQQEYQAQDDLRHLTKAAEIRKDKPRHKRALAHGHAKIAALKAALAGSAPGKTTSTSDATPPTYTMSDSSLD